MREPNSWSLPRRTLPNTEEEASSGAAAALAPIPTKSGYSKTCNYWPGWVASENASAVHGTGLLAKFNVLQSWWTLPGTPTSDADINQEVLWNGVTGTNDQLLQAETWFFGNNNDGNNSYILDCQYTKNGSSNFVNSDNPNWAYTNDNVYGTVVIEAAGNGSVGEIWECSANDNTQGYASTLTVTIPQGYAFTIADAFGYEVQGLSACDGLLQGPGQTAQVLTLSQEGSGSGGWDQYNNVLGNPNMTWGPMLTSGYNTPDCSYDSKMLDFSGVSYAELDWAN